MAKKTPQRKQRAASATRKPATPATEQKNHGDKGGDPSRNGYSKRIDKILQDYQTSLTSDVKPYVYDLLIKRLASSLEYEFIDHRSPGSKKDRSGPDATQPALTRFVVEGRKIWRQRGAENEFNREGLSIAAIDREITEAITPKGMPPLGPLDFMQWQRKPSNGIGKMKDGRVHISKSEAAAVAVQDRDEWLAHIIRADPFSLLTNKRIQEVVACWCYAEWHGDKGTSQAGKKLLKLAHLTRSADPEKGGAPIQYDFDDVQLRQVYDDLTEYGELLNRFWERTSSDQKRTSSDWKSTDADMVKLQKYFPDCKMLQDAKKSKIHIEHERLSGPSYLAGAYVQERLDMVPSTLHKRIDKLPPLPRSVIKKALSTAKQVAPAPSPAGQLHQWAEAFCPRKYK